MSKTDYEWLNLQSNHPYLAEKVVEYSHDPSCSYRLFLTMNDGSALVYNDLLGTVSEPRLDRYNPNPLSEARWRDEFASRLNEMMSMRLLTQESLAERTGISRNMIGRYCRGEGIPNVLNCTKMAAAMKCTVQELIDFL